VEKIDKLFFDNLETQPIEGNEAPDNPTAIAKAVKKLIASSIRSDTETGADLNTRVETLLE
jgi:hypothetical protein